MNWKDSPIVPFAISELLETENNKLTLTLVEKSGKSFCITTEDVCMELQNSRKVLFGEMKLFDNFFDSQSCNGIYAFFDKKECIYVGKCSSRSIIDRLGGHIAPRWCDYLNSMMKKVAVMKGSIKPADYKTSREDVYTLETIDYIKQLLFVYVPVLRKETDDKEYKNKVGRIESAVTKLLIKKIEQ